MTDKCLHFILTVQNPEAGNGGLLKVSDERNLKIDADSPYEGVPIACCAIDSAGFIRDYNEMFASLFGYKGGELIQVSFLDLTSGTTEDIIHKVGSGSNSKIGVFSRRLWLKRKDGSTFPAVLNIKLLFDSNHNIKFGNIVVIDDTFNYSAIEGIEKDKVELKKKERLKNEFVAIASHELRTPIQPILGFALLAKRGTISQEAAWEGVLGEARRLQQLANDILDVSRIESDNLKYEFTEVKINELIRHTVDSLTTDSNKDVSVSFEYPESEADIIIDADRSRITQVIANILGNAIKFSPLGGIKIKSKAIGDRFEFTISDTGGGISESVLPRLFEKFVTKDHGQGNIKGTGLGLYISKAIVLAHRGEITAFNKDGGATFLVKLPMHHDEDAEKQ